MNRNVANILRILCLIIVVVIFLLPIFWMLTISLKTPLDTLTVPPKLFFKPVWKNYYRIFQNPQVIRGFLNSLLFTFTPLIISLVIGLPAAYAMARYNFAFKRLFLIGILLGLMIPLITLALPFYVIYQRIGLLDTRSGMIIVYLIIDLPFVIWMMGVFIRQIPVELDESALIDGCTRTQILTRVILPISTPGIASASISCVIATWNEFLFALTLTRVQAKTAPVVIGSFMSTSGVQWGEMAAMATILILPAAAFGLSMQKYYMKGLTVGALKE